MEKLSKPQLRKPGKSEGKPDKTCRLWGEIRWISPQKGIAVPSPTKGHFLE